MMPHKANETDSNSERIDDSPDIGHSGSVEDEHEHVHEKTWLPEIWLLEQSGSAVEFYRRLGELIRSTGEFSDEERRLLAEQAEVPWAKRKGRPAESRRNWSIFMNYVCQHFDGPEMENRRPPSRKEAISLIMAEYNLAAEAATKAYDLAVRTNGQSPSIDRTKVARSKEKKKP